MRSCGRESHGRTAGMTQHRAEPVPTSRPRSHEMAAALSAVGRLPLPRSCPDVSWFGWEPVDPLHGSTRPDLTSPGRRAEPRSCVDGPRSARGVERVFDQNGECGHVSGLLVRPVPLAQMGSATCSQTRMRGWIPPDRDGFCRSSARPMVISHLSALALLASTNGSGRSRRAPEGFSARHHGPGDPGHLVGQGDRRELARPALQQFQQPG